MSPSKWIGLGVLGACASLAACLGGGGGGGTPSFDGGTDAVAFSDSGTVGDSGVATDSAAPGDGASGDSSSGTEGGTVSCSGVDAGSLPYTGIVELSRVSVPPAPARWAGIAQLETTATAPPQVACTGTVVGSCCYETSSGVTPTPESAGNITVADGTGTLGTLMPPAYVESNGATSTFTWKPGTALTVTAAGATLDAFSTTVVAPALFAGVTPALSSAITVSRSADFVISWTPAKEACSIVSFGFSQGSLMAHIGCSVDDSVGTITVPKALLGMFTGTSGSAVLERIEGRHTVSANAAVEVIAVNVVMVNTTYTP